MASLASDPVSRRLRSCGCSVAERGRLYGHCADTMPAEASSNGRKRILDVANRRAMIIGPKKSKPSTIRSEKTRQCGRDRQANKLNYTDALGKYLGLRRGRYQTTDIYAISLRSTLAQKHKETRKRKTATQNHDIAILSNLTRASHAQ